MSKYIQEEAWYCANARSNYLAAIGRDEIERTKNLFHAKRIEFARMKGYAPQTKTSDNWVKRNYALPENNGAA